MLEWKNKYSIKNKTWGAPKGYIETTEGQTLETYCGWVWRCPVCSVSYTTSGLPNDDGRHPYFQCAVCEIEYLIQYVLEE